MRPMLLLAMRVIGPLSEVDIYRLRFPFHVRGAAETIFFKFADFYCN
jgi:hypothetical protein